MHPGRYRGTALVGDPSGKTEMRQMLTLQQVNENGEALKRQLASFVNFDNGQALLLNNAVWLTKLEYIPFLTEQEKGILGYLLDHNQKTFTTDTDGGRASTLYARSIVQVLSKPGQSISVLDVPFHVPDHLWDVLEEHRDQLPNDWKERRLPWRASY